jgi:hypothetical protein
VSARFLIGVDCVRGGGLESFSEEHMEVLEIA